MVTPKSLAFSSHVILFPFKSKDKLCLFVLGPMATNLIGWYFYHHIGFKKDEKQGSC